MKTRGPSYRVVCGGLLVATVCASAQDRGAAPEGTSRLGQLQRMQKELSISAESLGDWSREQYPILAGALENMFEEYGWDSESDRWARETVLEINKIPPWKLDQRLQVMSQHISRRYRLDGGQMRKLHQLMYKSILQVGMKYIPIGMAQAKELIETRAKNQPFTPEQVARIEKAWDPYMDDILEDINGLTADFGKILKTDLQRATYRRDLESFNSRVDDILEAREAWKKGHWRPEAWGLQDDPIHARAYGLNRQSHRAIAVVSAALTYDESTWVAYVKAFIALYELDDGQQNTCHAILDNLVRQARKYRQAHRHEIVKLPARERPTHALLAPIRQMFEELKHRLDFLPTDKQYRQAYQRHVQESGRATHQDGGRQ